ncbi:MAG: hypothetical protein DHS20C05_24410 [Hyphococcus sp.]|nr:MAG: hypothetical protein DHS20C05_24410 [Marinicaulis sp.]
MLKPRLPLAVIATLIAALLTVSCGEKNLTILDAAALYEAQPEVFTSVRDRYPGPFSDFSRVPHRDPSKETRHEKEFLKELRQNIPVEFIDFFPMGETGRDEIDIIIKRYGLNNSDWTEVKIVYVGIPLPQPEEGTGLAVFNACDARALEWFEQEHEAALTRISAFCRINDYWYAYQSVS